MNEERREHPRLEIHRIAKYKVQNGTEISMGSIKDISGGGLCLKTKERFEKGEILQFEFELLGDTISILAEGEVMWCDAPRKDEKENLFHVGIKFVRIDEEKRKKVVEFIAQRLKMYVKDYLSASSDPPKTVLIIDDDIVTREIIRKVFKDHFNIIDAPDGYAGVDLAKEQKPDLILLDVMMPSIDGFSTLLLLKDFPETKDIPVIMLTVVQDREKIIQVLKDGATDYILKPFAPDKILSRIKEILKI